MCAATSFTLPNSEPVENRELPVKPPVMVTIPAGTFWMGTSDAQVQYLLEREDWVSEWFNSDLFLVEQPQHQVSLPNYEIALTPVTNAEYNVFIYNTGYRIPKHWIGFTFPDGMDDHPVTNVSKTDANAYCKWISKSLGSTFRLPSEAEWEQAARGSDTRIYPWGDNFDPWRCNTIESGKKQTTPAGSYSPGGDSPLGVTDTAGNVWEWTKSVMKPYPYKGDDGQSGKYVVRGGAWYYSRALARCSSREAMLPDYISPAIGFRLAR